MADPMSDFIRQANANMLQMNQQFMKMNMQAVDMFFAPLNMMMQGHGTFYQTWSTAELDGKVPSFSTTRFFGPG